MSRLNRLDSSLNLYAAPLVAPDVIRDNTPRPAIMEIHADTELFSTSGWPTNTHLLVFTPYFRHHC